MTLLNEICVSVEIDIEHLGEIDVSTEGTGKVQLSLEHLPMSENKEMLKKQKDGTERCHRDTDANLREFPMAEAGTICCITNEIQHLLHVEF